MDRFRLLLVSVLGLGCGIAFVTACEPTPTTSSPINTENDKKKKKGDDDTTADDDDATGDDDDVVIEPSDETLPDGGKPPGRVFAHTASSLYLFDPLVKSLKKIGDFNFETFDDGTERMLDLAVDRDSAVYGTTDHGFVKINPINAQIQYIKRNTIGFQFPNALSFVPTNTVDPTKEALVGYVQKAGTAGATAYVRIDVATGEMSDLGELNSAAALVKWRSSGDIVSTFRGGNKAYLTVKVLDESTDGGPVNDDPGTDFLAEVDPKTGKIIDVIGDIGQKNFYGLAQWAGTAYGFNEGGNIVEINLETGAGKTLLTLKEGDVVGAWFGAGMTTYAPTAP